MNATDITNLLNHFYKLCNHITNVIDDTLHPIPIRTHVMLFSIVILVLIISAIIFINEPSHIIKIICGILIFISLYSGIKMINPTSIYTKQQSIKIEHQITAKYQSKLDRDINKITKEYPYTIVSLDTTNDKNEDYPPEIMILSKTKPTKDQLSNWGFGKTIHANDQQLIIKMDTIDDQVDELPLKYKVKNTSSFQLYQTKTFLHKCSQNIIRIYD